MKALVLLSLSLTFLFNTASCSSTARVNNAAAPNSNSSQVAENQNTGDLSSQPSVTVEPSPSPNPQDGVLFDGKNYIKKSGWKVPSRDDTYIGDHQWNGKPREYLTEKGDKVKVVGKQFVYRTPRQHSQDFHINGEYLEFLKGPVKCYGLFEDTANGKVFMYTLYIQKEQTASMSNSNPEAPTSYIIQDRDGDGIFETLIGDDDELIVPNWVLR